MDRAIELALVERLRSGDQGAFDEVFDAYRGRVFAFLARLSRRSDLAEDLAEEVWLRLVTHARRLDPDTRLAAWLFTVARNLYWSYCRSRLLEDEHARDLMSLWTVPARHPTPFEDAAAGELERRVARAFASLAAPYREVLLLVAVEDLTPSEAAAVCGASPEALRKRLSRARAMLASALDAQGRPPAREGTRT